MSSDAAARSTWEQVPSIALLGKHAMFGVLRRDGIVVYESEAIAASLGFRPDEVVGQIGRMLLHPDDFDSAWSLADAAWSGEAGVRVFRFRHRNGSTRWMEVHATRIDDQHLLIYRRDVTERREAELVAERRNQEVEVLKTFAFAIADAKDFDGALFLMLRTLVERTGWEIGQAWTTTTDGLHVEPTSAWFSRDARFEPFREFSRTLKYAPGEGMVGRVWLTKKAWWLDATEAEARGFPRVKIARELGLIVSFCVPIVAEGAVVALLEFFSTSNRPEDRRMLDLAAVCAAQVGAILERRRVERGFEVLATALRHMDDAATVTIRRGESVRFEYANPAFKRLLGFEPAAILGRHPNILHGPATDREELVRVSHDLAARRTSRAELFFYDATGKARELEISVTPVPSDDGSEVTYVTFWRPVGSIDRRSKKSEPPESAAREAEIAWRQIFDALELPVILLSPSGKIEAGNAAAVSMLGQPMSLTLGKTLRELGAGEPWSSTDALVEDALRTGRGRSTNVPDAARGRTWMVTAAVLAPANARQRGVVVMAREIDIAGKVEEDQQRAGVLAELGRIVGGIVHDVRNPVFGIGATLDAVEARLGQSSDYAAHLRILRGELTRLTHLMNDLVAYGKPPRLTRSVHGLDAILDEVLARSADRLEKSDIALLHDRSSPPARVSVDRGRLAVALQTLIEHAIARSPASSVVGVRVSESLGTATITIEDRGPALTEAELARLFDPFFVLRGRVTGLALSIVQRIVEQHGGRITAAGGPAGGGLVMTLALMSAPTPETLDGR